MKHPTPYAVRCTGDTLDGVATVRWPCGIVYLQYYGQHGYDYQMNKPDSGWYCPNCGSTAVWQDDIYEEAIEEREKDACDPTVPGEPVARG
ncbi:hypothetical protein LCGC14_0757440 [marine sediment metagenome]|uniref:Uncharacterized protein n=1 Tax=marine sediment metagenome TaxID=412755 RepID=A0A0F9QM08_9ZZZZ